MATAQSAFISRGAALLGEIATMSTAPPVHVARGHQLLAEISAMVQADTPPPRPDFATRGSRLLAEIEALRSRPAAAPPSDKILGSSFDKEADVPLALAGGQPQPGAAVQMWREGALCDATVLARAGDGQILRLRAHRLVLAAGSGYCRALLASPHWAGDAGQAEAGAVVDLRSHDPLSVEHLLEFMYTGECVLPRTSALEPLLELAAFCVAEDCVAAIGRLMARRLTPRGLCGAVEAAGRFPALAAEEGGLRGAISALLREAGLRARDELDRAHGYRRDRTAGVPLSDGAVARLLLGRNPARGDAPVVQAIDVRRLERSAGRPLQCLHRLRISDGRHCMEAVLVGDPPAHLRSLCKLRLLGATVRPAQGDRGAVALVHFAQVVEGGARVIGEPVLASALAVAAWEEPRGA